MASASPRKVPKRKHAPDRKDRGANKRAKADEQTRFQCANTSRRCRAFETYAQLLAAIASHTEATGAIEALADVQKAMRTGQKVKCSACRFAAPAKVTADRSSALELHTDRGEATPHSDEEEDDDEDEDDARAGSWEEKRPPKRDGGDDEEEEAEENDDVD